MKWVDLATEAGVKCPQAQFRTKDDSEILDLNAASVLFVTLVTNPGEVLQKQFLTFQLQSLLDLPNVSLPYITFVFHLP